MLRNLGGFRRWGSFVFVVGNMTYPLILLIAAFAHLQMFLACSMCV
jgi:hypothetical protein